MEAIKFSNVKLANSGKSGNLPVDADGYRSIIVGGLNIFNSNGEYYTLQGARDLFEKSSSFMRRIGRGALRGENGHPAFLPGMTMDEYIGRVMNIDEGNVCAHFSEVWLDFNSVKTANGVPTVAIMAKVKPSGKLSYILEQAFNNPKENVCFSIRAATKDYWDKGVKMRQLDTIITFDYVNEPGIAIAEKYLSPTLESLDEKVVSKSDFISVTQSEIKGLATESSKEIANEVIRNMGWDLPAGTRVAFSNW